MVGKAGDSGAAQVAERGAAQAQRSAAGRVRDVHHCIIKMRRGRSACWCTASKGLRLQALEAQGGRVDADVRNQFLGSAPGTAENDHVMVG